LLAAFDKRCNYFTDKRADPMICEASLRLLTELAPSPQSPVEWTPDLFHTWNAQFKPEKQARHLKVFPLVADITTREFSQKQIFIKMEALLKRHDKNWAPRIINQSSDIHNVILGPVMQTCTKRIVKLMSQRTNPEDGPVFSVAYAKDTEDLCSHILQGGASDAMFLESDFSNNDSTQVRDVVVLEVEWLRRLGAPLWITSLMLLADSYVVTSREYAVKGRVKHQLPTGAQSTTFRNTLWNSSMVWAFANKHKIRGNCLVLGDDMLLRIDNPFSRTPRVIRREYEYITKLACMTAKVKVRKHLSECEFLSKQFIMTNNGYVLVPKLGKALARFNVRASVNDAVSDSNYLAGKALSYAYEFRHMPVLQRAFFERFEQLAETVDEVTFDGLAWNVKGSFLRYGVEGIIERLKAPASIATRDDMNRFYHYKYSMFASDVLELVLAVLFGEDDLDAGGIVRICEDFLD